jgi:hypothetical protein
MCFRCTVAARISSIWPNERCRKSWCCVPRAAASRSPRNALPDLSRALRIAGFRDGPLTTPQLPERPAKAMSGVGNRRRLAERQPWAQSRQLNLAGVGRKQNVCSQAGRREAKAGLIWANNGGFAYSRAIAAVTLAPRWYAAMGDWDPDNPRLHYISTSRPTSTTWAAGTPKYAAGRLALRCIAANSDFRQTAMPDAAPGITITRLK